MPKMNVEMMMLIRLNRMPKMFIAPSTMIHEMTMGRKQSSEFFRLKRNEISSTRSTKAIETHCSTLKSCPSWRRVSCA